jgi:hypothetical protein
VVAFFAFLGGGVRFGVCLGATVHLGKSFSAGSTFDSGVVDSTGGSSSASAPLSSTSSICSMDHLTLNHRRRPTTQRYDGKNRAVEKTLAWFSVLCGPHQLRPPGAPLHLWVCPVLVLVHLHLSPASPAAVHLVLAVPCLSVPVFLSIFLQKLFDTRHDFFCKPFFCCVFELLALSNTADVILKKSRGKLTSKFLSVF